MIVLSAERNGVNDFHIYGGKTKPHKGYFDRRTRETQRERVFTKNVSRSLILNSFPNARRSPSPSGMPRHRIQRGEPPSISSLELNGIYLAPCGGRRLPPMYGNKNAASRSTLMAGRLSGFGGGNSVHGTSFSLCSHKFNLHNVYYPATIGWFVMNMTKIKIIIWQISPNSRKVLCRQLFSQWLSDFVKWNHEELSHKFSACVDHMVSNQICAWLWRQHFGGRSWK